jgi:hypothetical protein
MSIDRYVCCDERRRALLAAGPADKSGIDYIEVNSGPTTADPTKIRIVLVKPLALPMAALTADNVVLTGGVRYPAPKINPAIAVVPGPVAGTVAEYVVTIPGNQLTDFSTYRLALVSGPGSATPPTFIDPRLSAVDFSFKIDCASDFDCAPCDDEVDELPPDPSFDYRVRDYPTFRRQLLDRLAELVPGFREDDPVDFTTTLVEALAYRADQQSYRLDWVGTEPFLPTARSRTSIARHARLTDYRVGEGASARVFARFELEPAPNAPDGLELAAATPLLARVEGVPPVIPAASYRSVLATAPIVFETVDALEIWAWRNHIKLHTWADDECRLPKGSSAVTLVDESGGPGAGQLVAGDVLLLAEIASPETGDMDDARPERRHVVRLTSVAPAQDVLDTSGTLKLLTVEWSERDALPFDLVIQTRVKGALGGAASVVCAEAAGNIILADHGASAPPPAVLGLTPSETEALRPSLTPAVPPPDEPWRPILDRADVSRIESVNLAARPMVPANSLASVDPARVLPALWLDDDFGTWTARGDLLESGQFTRDFVVETAIDGRATVRFGDGANGLPPAPGSILVPRGRFGVGPAGNIGPGALAHVVVPTSQEGARLVVTNPLPARGGAAPEPISAVRIAAPQAFRQRDRAVTAADYAEAAKHHAEVSNAVAIARWTGAWQTILVYVDRKGGVPVDAAFRRSVLGHLEHYRLMGFDTALREAKSAPLDIELLVCAAPAEFRSTVAARVRDRLRPSGGATGVHGFFHPDHFTFGSPLYLSSLVAAVMGVEGVKSTEPTKFQRLDRLPHSELVDEVIRPNEFEVLRLDDDPSFPERGRLVLTMAGGR